MAKIKVDEVTDEAGTGATDFPQGATGVSGRGFKNYIIGGDFLTNPWQRGTSFTGTNEYTADRWKFLQNDSGSVSQDTDGQLKMTRGSGGTYQFVEQFVENFMVLNEGETFTLSFEVFSNETALMDIRISETDTASVSDYFYSTKSVTNGAWVSHAITFTAASSRTYDHLAVQFNTIGGGGTISTGNYIKLRNIQLEKGPTATEFEYRPYGLELGLCRHRALDLYAQKRLNAYRIEANVIYFFVNDNEFADSGTGASSFGTEATDWQVYSKAGAAQTGFSLAIVSVDEGGAVFSATKTSHGLSDAVIRTNTQNTNIISREL